MISEARRDGRIGGKGLSSRLYRWDKVTNEGKNSTGTKMAGRSRGHGGHRRREPGIIIYRLQFLFNLSAVANSSRSRQQLHARIEGLLHLHLLAQATVQKRSRRLIPKIIPAPD